MPQCQGIFVPLVNSLDATVAQASSVSPDPAAARRDPDALLQAVEEARISCVAQLRALSGCAKGLTNNVAPLNAISVSEEEEEENMAKMEEARADPRMVELRARITAVMGQCTSIWSADAEVGEVCRVSFLARLMLNC